MSEENYNPYVTAQTQFDSVASQIGLDQSARDLLRQPSRIPFYYSGKNG